MDGGNATASSSRLTLDMQESYGPGPLSSAEMRNSVAASTAAGSSAKFTHRIQAIISAPPDAHPGIESAEPSQDLDDSDDASESTTDVGEDEEACT